MKKYLKFKKPYGVRIYSSFDCMNNNIDSPVLKTKNTIRIY